MDSNYLNELQIFDGVEEVNKFFLNLDWSLFRLLKTQLDQLEWIDLAEIVSINALWSDELERLQALKDGISLSSLSRIDACRLLALSL